MPTHWDVFISHASEDRKKVARPLAQLLKDAGLRVWLDVDQIQVGHSLTAEIDKGLAQSRCGVVILSKSFFAKKWTRRELGGLVAMDSGFNILPIWHKIDSKYVRRHSPTLADAYALNTASGLKSVAAALVSRIGPIVHPSPAEYTRRLSELVTAQKPKRTLYVSIGPADFIRPWLRRLMQSSAGAAPAINRIVILGISKRTARRLQRKGRLPKGFLRRMLENVAAIPKETGIPVVHKDWADMPKFHGLAYGDVALVGQWGDQDGMMNVDTPITEVSRNNDPASFNQILAAFRKSTLHV